MNFFELVKEMAYPVSFSFEKLKSLKTFKDKKAYIESMLQKIGAGSSRIAYAVDEEKILKLAKNRKGLAQNEVEYNNSSNDLDCLSKVYNFDPEGYWIEAEIAAKCKPSDIKRLYNISFNDLRKFICDCVYEYGDNLMRRHAKGTSNMFPSKIDLFHLYIKEKLSEKLYNFLDSLYYYFSNYQPSWSEICDYLRIANWGIVKRNGQEIMVIIDSGLNEEVYNTHYKRSWGN